MLFSISHSVNIRFRRNFMIAKNEVGAPSSAWIFLKKIFYYNCLTESGYDGNFWKKLLKNLKWYFYQTNNIPTSFQKSGKNKFQKSILVCIKCLGFVTVWFLTFISPIYRSEFFTLFLMCSLRALIIFSQIKTRVCAGKICSLRNANVLMQSLLVPVRLFCMIFNSVHRTNVAFALILTYLTYNKTWNIYNKSIML